MGCGLMRYGTAWPIEARRDLVRHADVSTEGFGPLCCLHWRQMRQVTLGSVPVRLISARQGRVRPGKARLSKGYRRWHGGSSLPAILMDGFGKARPDLAERGLVGHGGARQGKATADDLSTEPFGALCWVLWNPVLARRGKAMLGKLRLGVTRRATVN